MIDQVNGIKREEARLLNDKFSKLKGQDVFKLNPREAPSPDLGEKVVRAQYNRE